MCDTPRWVESRRFRRRCGFGSQRSAAQRAKVVESELREIHHLTCYEHGGRTGLADLPPLYNRDHTRGPDGHVMVRTRRPAHCAP